VKLAEFGLVLAESIAVLSHVGTRRARRGGRDRRRGRTARGVAGTSPSGLTDRPAPVRDARVLHTAPATRLFMAGRWLLLATHAADAGPPS
ncbi:hypothetical protein N4G70_36555, partial [Streptomyces sp. ASQP_92]|uniref:hypothetical protein n=1 Tax=Streptomyces sp. ASQP_92 TaxID=2979116 RepID=UPI0021C05035